MMASDHSDLGFVPEVQAHDDLGFVPDAPKLSNTEKALETIGKIGRGIDSVTGAPTRAAVYALENGENPFNAALNQFGNSESAPTGKMIMQKLGVSDTPISQSNLGKFIANATPAGMIGQRILPQSVQDQIKQISPADVTGFGADVALDPTNALPFAKPLLKGASKGVEMFGNALMKEPLAQKAAEGVNSLGRGASKVGEAISGAPAQDIRTYWNKGPEVNAAIDLSGKNSAQLADNTRKGYQFSIGQTRKDLNSQISAAEDAIKSAGPDKAVSVSPLVKKLEKYKSRLDPDLDKSEIGQLDEIIGNINNAGGDLSKVSPDRLIKIARSLQNKGGTYGISPSGAQLGNLAQQGAKSAGTVATELRDAHIPGVAEPFDKLQTINKIAEESNPNLFQPGKPDAALFSAGAGKNDRGIMNLEKMGEATGTDMLGPAQIASSARTFMSPSLTPTDTTGKSLYRALLSAGIFGQGLGLLGAPIEATSKLGAAAASPAALKLGMDAAHFAGAIPGKTMDVLQNLPTSKYVGAYGALKVPEVKNLLDRYHLTKNRSSGAGTQSGGIQEKSKSNIQPAQGQIPMSQEEARARAFGPNGGN